VGGVTAQPVPVAAIAKPPPIAVIASKSKTKLPDMPPKAIARKGTNPVLLALAIGAPLVLLMLCGGGGGVIVWIMKQEQAQPRHEEQASVAPDLISKPVPKAEPKAVLPLPEPPQKARRAAGQPEPKQEQPKKQEPPNEPTLIHKPGEPSLETWAQTLYSDYDNELAGDTKYLGKVIDLKLSILQISGMFKRGGRYFLGMDTLANERDNVGVICEIHLSALSDFLPERISARAKEPGSPWRVRGVCKGRKPTTRISPGYEVLMERCILVRINKVAEKEAMPAAKQPEAKAERQPTPEEIAEMVKREQEEKKARIAFNQASQLAGRGFKEQARKRYQEIIDKYPRTETAGKAKKQLEKD
jgi:hypothetical protein